MFTIMEDARLVFKSLLETSGIVFEMGIFTLLGTMLRHPLDFFQLGWKYVTAKWVLRKQIHRGPHWAFCYNAVNQEPHSFGLGVLLLAPEIHDALCITHLVIRALDTIEDDTSIPTDVKVPILTAFHQHIYDQDWHFSCGTGEWKNLTKEFHHVSTALLELPKGIQEIIVDIAMKIGAGMAKFIGKEIVKIEDYDEYGHYVAGLVIVAFSKICHAAELEHSIPDSLSNSVGLFFTKTDMIQDYFEDINELPKSRKFWPREIWSKYASELEDFKYADNSVKAVQCLNEMVTDALIYTEDCLKYVSKLRDPTNFRCVAVLVVITFGILVTCYNNIEVFSGVVKARRGLAIKVMARIKSMSDVYDAFFDFSNILKAKVNENDPNAALTLSRIDALQKVCKDSGVMNKRRSPYTIDESKSNSLLGS